MAAPNLVNAERVSITFGTRTILDEQSVGVGQGEVIGVVGRNGDGKSTLLTILTGELEPDSGRVTRTHSATIGHLRQRDTHPDDATVRDVIVGGEPDHVWAREPYRRDVVAHLLGEIDLDARLGRLSGGERRRVDLVSLMFGQYDLLVLDEPTNHLDVEAVDWLARHLRTLQTGRTAMLVVSHDRWFLDAICSRIWEVHDGVVDAYDGGYAAYVLARAERARQAAATEQRRQNLVRKELAWLRRGAPARTSKPQFRVDAANALIADEPPPRDSLQLQQFATTRLGKDVIDLTKVDLAHGDRVLFDDLTWSLAPGARIGLVGVNGAGKSTLLRLMAKEIEPTGGKVRHGLTVRLAHLTQAVAELDGDDRVLESVQRLRARTTTAAGRDVSVTSLLEDFGFTGDRLTTRVADLSGGERRRLQFLRLILDEPNVMLLDEPTNDLDIDTLTVIEDHLDSWPGTLVVVSHDRYFLERVCDVTYALMGDGTCVLLPGGVEAYLDHRRELEAGRARASSAPPSRPAATSATSTTSAADLRRAKKDLARLEGRMATIDDRTAELYEEMAAAASDHTRLLDLQSELDALAAEKDALEAAWLEAAELVEG